MKVLSAHLWEKGREDTSMPISVVLQQAEVRRKNVLLACVCEGKHEGETGVLESGYFTEGLTEWFHREGVKFCERKEGEKVADSLHSEVERLQKENREYMHKKNLFPNLHYWGIFMWENRAWIFAKGECKGYLLNRRFQKKNLREIVNPKAQKEGIWMKVGIQKKIGILLCTEGFMEGLSAEYCLAVLIPEGEITEERMQKRLQELQREQSHKGKEKAVGAIYLRT